MKYENFDEFYANLNTNGDILKKWQELSNKKKRQNLIMILIIIIIDIIIILKLKTFLIFLIVPIFIIDIFIFILSVLLFRNKEIIKFNNNYKEEVINKLLDNFIEDIDYIPLKGMPSNIYNEAKYGGYYNKYHSDDYFEGKIKGQKIIMADLLVEEETVTKDADGNEKRETTTIFNGLFGKIDLEKSIETNLCISRECNLFNFSKRKLEMDSFEFEKVFNVYTDNKIIAMQLLTADIQEEILQMYNMYKINFYIAIYNNKMYILFKTGSMFEVFSAKKNPTEVLKKYFEIMKFIYKVIEELIDTIDKTQI